MELWGRFWPGSHPLAAQPHEVLPLAQATLTPRLLDLCGVQSP